MGVKSLLAAVVILASAAAGVGAWALVRGRSPLHPEISVYSHGQLVRVGPYRYCKLLNLNDCENPGTLGELRVSARDPVQLSVSPSIGRAPWVLLPVYENPADLPPPFYPHGSRLAVTIPTVDPKQGRLTGIAVQSMTKAVDQTGELHYVPNAEWSVRTVWS
jgi:hypothetical protein